jgi:HTH-type transcriptional regulator/antitoxin HigA
MPFEKVETPQIDFPALERAVPSWSGASRRRRVPPEEKEVSTMAVKTNPWLMPDAYFDLVKQFPLTHLRDDEHLKAAQEILDRLLQEELEDGVREYRDVLTDLIEAYEEKHVVLPDASVADVLRELMRSNGLSLAKLAKSAGITQSTLSNVLKGSRSLSKEQVVKLAKFFNVSPAAFLPS